ncbi:MAG: ATP synthase subunit I [Gammaproteobacteria bacterium]|nr:ATP synthase subunit I [Gammaproteobacteria bacterium]MBU1624579.1 ATP synthase subunit I [Gammaproteobacteria bacterium]MBU1982423.1 ATP synthase subunit I [Gammaproteobacteria bacterium]
MGKQQQECLTPRENAAIIPPLFLAEEQEKKSARQVIWFQLATLSVVSAVMAWGSSPQNAIAVLGGGGISILNGALIAWRMSRATRHPVQNAHQQLRLMYFYATERFLAVVVLLGLVLVILKDSPLMVIGGFVLGQATLLAARLLLKNKTESGSQNVQ